MNKLNYLLLISLSLFIFISLAIKPKSFESYFKSDIDVTIPEENLSKDIQKTQSITFDIETFSSALEKEETRAFQWSNT